MRTLKLLPGTTVRCTIPGTSLRPVHKSTIINYTNRCGGGSPFRCCFVAVSPVPQGGLRPFIALSYHYRLSFYRYRYRTIETISILYYRFFTERYYRKCRYDILHY